MKEIYIVGGTSGAGKTTLIKTIKEKSNINVISTGDLFNTVVNKLFSIDIKRDKFKHVNWKAFEPYVISSLCSIIEYIDIPKLVIDTHYAVYSPSGFVSGLSDESIHYFGGIIGSREYKKCYCILIDAPIEEIHRRVLQDRERRIREEISLGYLRDEKKWNRTFQEKYVSILSKYIKTEKKIIENIILKDSLTELEKSL